MENNTNSHCHPISIQPTIHTIFLPSRGVAVPVIQQCCLKSQGNMQVSPTRVWCLMANIKLIKWCVLVWCFHKDYDEIKTYPSIRRNLLEMAPFHPTTFFVEGFSGRKWAEKCKGLHICMDFTNAKNFLFQHKICTIFIFSFTYFYVAKVPANWTINIDVKPSTELQFMIIQEKYF